MNSPIRSYLLKFSSHGKAFCAISNNCGEIKWIHQIAFLQEEFSMDETNHSMHFYW